MDTIYGTYTSVGMLGNAFGTVGRATAHHISDCFRQNRKGTIHECYGLWIDAQTHGDENWAILSKGGKNEFHGPVLLQLDGMVKQVTQGPPNSCGPGLRCLAVAN